MVVLVKVNANLRQWDADALTFSIFDQYLAFQNVSRRRSEKTLPVELFPTAITFPTKRICLSKEYRDVFYRRQGCTR